MNNRRAKLAAGAMVLGLGALGGVALGTNHGVPATAGQLAAGSGSAPVVTSASGAAVAPAELPSETRAPGARFCVPCTAASPTPSWQRRAARS